MLVSKQIFEAGFFIRISGGTTMAQMTGLNYKIQEMAHRIRELREIENFTIAEMANKTASRSCTAARWHSASTSGTSSKVPART